MKLMLLPVYISFMPINPLSAKKKVQSESDFMPARTSPSGHLALKGLKPFTLDAAYLFL